MQDHKKTKAQLILELEGLRRTITSGGVDREAWSISPRAGALEGAWEQCIDALDDDLCILDMSGSIIAVNRAMQERFGLNRSHLLGRHYRRVFYGSDVSDSEPPWDAVLSGALSAQVETFLPAMNGWFSVSCYALLNPQGQQWGVVSMGKNITVRKQREDFLRNLSQGRLAVGGIIFFRELVLALAEALDVSCAYIGELTENKSVMRTVAVCVQGEIGNNFEFSLAHTPCEVALKEHRARFTTGAESWIANIEALAALGLDSYVGLPLWDSAGRPLGVMAVMDRHAMIDPKLVESMLQMVTARVASELERKQADDSLQKMQEDLLNARKLESIGLLAGGIAHDFNNILTALLGNVSLAKVEGVSREKLEQRLVEAEDACFRARELTQRLLTFAKGGAPVMTAVAAGSLINQEVTRAIQRDDVRCTFTLPVTLPDLCVDAGQITQVLQNVVTNACEAMPQGGLLTVEAEHINFELDEPLFPNEGSYVKVTIQDQGSGISQVNLPKVLDPFFTTRPPKSGLGLAVAYSIMNHHGGRITIESDIGIGTVVTLYLPVFVHMAPLPEQILEGKETVEELKGTILVVEDEEPICDLLRQIMAHLGYTVVFAKSGLEGIALYTRARNSGMPFQAVLVDLVMPGEMGGKEMMEHLRTFDPEIKAIVSSGYSSDPVMGEYEKYGFQAAIAKPYRMSGLSVVLHDVIHRT